MELGSADAFDRMGTLGIEEEFYIVDADGHPTSGIDELVYGPEPPEPLTGRLDHELFEFTIETQTPRLEAPADVDAAVRAVREALVEHASNHGYRIAAAGLHPAAKWRELEHATKPRYQAQLDRIQYPQHRNTTSGLHVHVGVDDPDKAVWIANELRWYVGPILALSANSPFWNGFDTGLASARAKIFENLPNTGMPTAFADFEEFQEFERRMVEHGSIDDRGELWYDVRPHTGHGTVEIRTPDAQTDPSRVVDFVEYVHALVLDLADRYESGETGTDIRREILDENKWRAIRYGREASFITPDVDGVVELETFVEAESERLGVDGLRSLFDADSGTDVQRRILADEGLDALCEYLTLE
ncbi:glutamate--cysteine ligase [Haloferax sp. YSSS75]|uniref:glutamate--cysteine ligase n=1 Tax=Haloferax sp. YSSS75 TaxID=3388564 RepID=UPI00398C9019